VQERGTLVTYIDEGSLHPGQNPSYSTQDDVAYGTAVRSAFDLKLGDDAVFNERDARFPKIDVDNDNISSHARSRATSTNRPD
jgi:hypothetical protein